VPEYLALEALTAFSTNPGLKINGWDSLLPYHVAWVDGREICKDRLGHATKITLEHNEVALLRFLAENRAQVGVLGLRKGRTLLQRLNITNVHPLSPPLEIAQLYLYLHKKHEALVPRVTAMLRTLKKDGTYEAIRQHFFEGTPYPIGMLSTAQL
jgi:polar amino acid transport system substrate-binding protein